MLAKFGKISIFLQILNLESGKISPTFIRSSRTLVMRQELREFNVTGFVETAKKARRFVLDFSSFFHNCFRSADILLNSASPESQDVINPLDIAYEDRLQLILHEKR